MAAAGNRRPGARQSPPMQRCGILLSPHFFACQSTGQSNDLIALDCDVVVENEGIGETGPVEVAIDFGRDNGFAVAVGNVDDFEGDPGIEDLAVAPGLDGGGAAELPAY